MNALDEASRAPQLFELALYVKTYVISLLASSVRILAAMLVFPATQDGLLQGGSRQGLAVVLGMYVAAGGSSHGIHELDSLALTFIMCKEAFIGVVLGLCISSVFWIAESVGALIDNIAGFNNIQQTNPVSGQQNTPLGNLLLQLSIVGFYALGGFAVFAGLLLDSYAWWPIESRLPNGQELLLRFVVAQTGSIFETMLRIAGPVLVVLILIDLGIGLIAKAAEKLEPASLSQPIKGATALLLLVLLLAAFFGEMRASLTLEPMVRQIESQLRASEAR